MLLPIRSWRTTLTRLGLKIRTDKKPGKRKPRQLQMEALEPRQLFATVWLGACQDGAEGGANAVFTIHRDSTAGDLEVSYSLGGTASTDDYTSPSSSSGSVTFADGQSTVTLNVTPCDESEEEGSESVILDLASGSGYEVSSSSGSATVWIQDNDSNPPVLDLDADDSSGQSGTGFAATFVENGVAVAIADNDASLTDSDSAQLATLTVTITNRLDGSDETLSANTTGTNLQVAFADGVLTVSGNGTVEEYQQVLRTLRYHNAALAPHTESRIITVAANDGQAMSNVATATVAVSRVNRPPVAQDQELVVAQDSFTYILLGDDGDPEASQKLTLTILTSPSHGVLVGYDSATGEIWYMPDSGYLGTDSFSYRLTDDATAGAPAAMSSQDATVSIVVRELNLPPIAAPQSAAVEEDSQVAITLTGQSGNSVAQGLTFAIVAEPAHGTLSGFDPTTGQVTYIPAPGYAGPDSFQFAVIDDASLAGPELTSEAVEVALTVSPVNDVPVALTQSVGVGMDRPRTIALGSDGDDKAAQTLTLSIVTPPAHGTLSGFDPATGEILYTPDPGYIGPDSFQFTLTDDGAAGIPEGLTSAIATVSINVSAQCAADEQAVTIAEDTEISLTLTGDDGDAENVQSLVFAIVASPSQGTLKDFDPLTGRVTYTPNPDYNGIDEFHFTVSYTPEGGAAIVSDLVAVVLTISAVNDAPQESNFAITIPRDTAVPLSLGHDGDPDVVQQLTLVVTTPPSHGTLSDFDPLTGEILYTPNSGYTGPDSFRFTLTDDLLAGSPETQTSGQGWIELVIKAAPTAEAQTLTTAEDAQLTLTLAGQLGQSEETLAFAIVGTPSHGTIMSFDPATGAVVYLPDEGYHGEDSFAFVTTQYSETDGSELKSQPAVVTITVTAVNDAPMALTASVVTGQSTATPVVLAGTDGDDEVEQSLTFAIVAQPSHGTLSGFDAATGAVIYTPEPGYHGPDSFTFQVVDDATAGGDARTSEPVAVEILVGAAPLADAQSCTAAEDTPAVLALTGRGGVEGAQASLSYIIVQPPQHGSISQFDPIAGTITYTPGRDYVGTDSFSFAVLDASAAPGLALRSAAAVVTLTVTAVDDAPRVENQSATLAEGTRIVLTLGDCGDPEASQLLTLNVIDGPAHGVLSAFDPLTGTVVYTPSAGYAGADGFTYTLADDGNPSQTSAVAAVTIDVTAVNHRPAGNQQQLATTENAPLAIVLTGDDGESEGEQTLTFWIVSPPNHGELSGFDSATGTVIYTPDPDYNGPDSFAFVVMDEADDSTGSLTSEPTTVGLTVNPINAAPVVEDLSLTAMEDQDAWLSLAGDDSDPEIDQALTFTIVSGPSHGTISNFDPSTGHFAYTPDPNYHGTDSITYTVTDDSAAGGPALTSTEMTVSVTVSQAGSASLAEPVAGVTVANQSVQLTLGTSGNDDAVQDLTFAIIGGPSHGTLSNFNASTGEVTYTPQAGYSGVDTITFWLFDNSTGGAPTTATVLIDARPATALPSATSDTVTIRPSDGEVLLDVLANDTFSGSGSLAIVSVSSPSHGTVSIEGNALRYVPEPGYVGGVVIAYTIEDSSGNRSTANVDLTSAAAGAVATGGGISVGGIGFDCGRDSSFTPPVVGNLTASRSSTGDPFTSSWTDSGGTSYPTSGTQSSSVTIVSSSYSNGDWLYTETGSWSYDVTFVNASYNVHLWGNLHYTFNAGCIAGSEFFNISVGYFDFYDNTVLVVSGDAASGSSVTYNSTGLMIRSLYLDRMVNSVGLSAHNQYHETLIGNDSSNGSYWYSPPNGFVSGSTHSNSSLMQVMSVAVGWHYDDILGWLGTGNAMSVGYGTRSSGYNGSGTYHVVTGTSEVLGTISESGSKSGFFMNKSTGILLPDQTWGTLGNGSDRENGSDNWSSQGSGVYNTPGSASDRTWSMSGTLTESAARRSRYNRTLSLGVGTDGWAVTSGSASNTVETTSSNSYSGAGAYTHWKSSGSDGRTWTINGTGTECGGSQQRDKQQISSTYNGVDWLSNGSASGRGQTFSARTYTGSGDYTSPITLGDASGSGPGPVRGTIRGDRYENGNSFESQTNQTVSAMVANGPWVTTGQTLGFNHSYTHSHYSGSGSYSYPASSSQSSSSSVEVTGTISGKASDGGSEDTWSISAPIWTLSASGQWDLTAGSGSHHTVTTSYSSRSASGVIVETSSSGHSGTADMSGSGNQWHWKETAREESSENSMNFESTTWSSVIGGAWAVTSGTSRTEGNSKGSVFNDYWGFYGYNRNGVDMFGMLGGSGYNSQSASFFIDSEYHPASGNPYSGAWSASGEQQDWTTNWSDAWTVGSGTYSRVTGTTSSGSPSASGGSSGSCPDVYSASGAVAHLVKKTVPVIIGSKMSGTVTESSNRWQSASSWSLHTLGPNSAGAEVWTLSDGVETASGNSDDSFNLNATGSYWRTGPGWNVNGTTQLIKDKHNESDYDGLSIVVDGEWRLALGSGSGSGRDNSFNSTTGGGTYSETGPKGKRSGTVTESDSDTENFSYETTSFNQAGEWATTGSASGLAFGNRLSRKTTTHATYNRSVSGLSCTVSGRYNGFEEESSNHRFTTQFTLSPAGEWTVASGSGSSFVGAGGGFEYSGTGTYSLPVSASLPKLSFLSDSGETVTYSLNGVITESGRWSIQEGEKTFWTYNTTENRWDETGTAPWLKYHNETRFSNDAFGNYKRGAITGTFTRSQGHSTTIDWERNASASGAAAPVTAHSGFRKEVDDHSFNWSFLGSGPHQASGWASASGGSSTVSGTLTEFGSGYTDHGLTVNFAPVGKDDWLQTTKTTCDAFGDNRAVSFTVTRPYFYDSLDPLTLSYWSMSGTETQTIGEGKSYQERVTRTWLGPEPLPLWGGGSGSSERTNYYFGSTNYSGSGGYVTFTDDGSIVGTHNENNSYSYDGWTRENGTLAFLPILGLIVVEVWSFTGDGEDNENSTSHYTYNGTGSYEYLSILGTIQESGGDHSTWSRKREYRKTGTDWEISGTGTGSGSGGWTFLYFGAGSYTGVIPGGTTAGTRGEYGSENYAYNYNYTEKLGKLDDKFVWGYTHLSGGALGTGSYNYWSSGAGSYQKTFDQYGVLNGTAQEDSANQWSYRYTETYSPSNRKWLTTTSGSASGTSHGNFHFSGSGTYNGATLTEDAGNGYTQEWEETWNSGAGGLTWNWTSTSTSSGSGTYLYSSNNVHHSTYEEGDYAAGNGSITTYHTETERSISETFAWDETKVEHQASASGTISRWHTITGSGWASGEAVENIDNLWTYQRASNDGGTSYSESESSASSVHSRDTYDATADWTETLGSDGSTTYDPHFSNDVSGTQTQWGSYSRIWSEVTSGSASGSGGGSGSATGGSTNSAYGPTTTAYNRTIDSEGFDYYRYTNPDNLPRYMPGSTHLPYSSSASSYVPPPDEGSSSSSSGGGTPPPAPPDPLAGGPWYKLPPAIGTPDDDGLLSLLSPTFCYATMFDQGLGGEPTWEDIENAPKTSLDPRDPTFVDRVWGQISTTLSNMSASDWLMVGSLATLTVIGLITAPYVTIPAMLVAAGAGAGLGAAYNIAGQFDQGAGWADLDWASVTGSAITGGVMGALSGGGFAMAAAVVPSFCMVATGIGVASSAKGIYDGINNYNQGNTYTGILDMTLGALGLAGAARGAFSKASQAVGGACFVAGTQVVRYMIVSTAEAGSEETLPASESGGAGTLVLVALGSITAGVFVRREDERRRREEEKRQNAIARDRLFGPPPDDEESDLPWDEDDDPWTEPVDAPWAGPADDAPGDAAHRARIDRLCDALFHGDEDFDPLSDDSPASDWPPRPDESNWVARPEERRAWLNREPSLPSSTALAPPRRVKKRRTAQRCEQPAVRTAPPEPRKRLSLRWPMLAASLLALLLFAPGILSSWRSSPPIPQQAAGPEEDWLGYETCNIEDIQVGDTVLAMDVETGDLRPRRVVDAFQRTVYHLQVLEIGSPGGPSQTIRTTDEHPFWVVDEEDFLPAAELQPGDRFLSPDGEVTELLSSAVEPHPEGVVVYNFEVEGAHTYYVRAGEDHGDAVLVHNACHRNSKNSTSPNHVYEIRNKLTGEVRKYGISGGKIRRDGKSYRAESQVRDFNRKAGADIYESRIIARNLTRTKALSMEQGRVNGYSISGQRSGAFTKPKGPLKNELPLPRM